MQAGAALAFQSQLALLNIDGQQTDAGSIEVERGDEAVHLTAVQLGAQLRVIQFQLFKIGFSGDSGVCERSDDRRVDARHAMVQFYWPAGGRRCSQGAQHGNHIMEILGNDMHRHSLAERS